MVDACAIVISLFSLLFAIGALVVSVVSKRSILAVEKIEYDDDHERGPRAELYVKNCGERPAGQIEVYYKTVFYSDDKAEMVIDDEERLALIMPSGLSRRFIYYFNDVDQSEYENASRILFRIEVSYSDLVFKTRHSQLFYFTYRRRDGDSDRFKLQYAELEHALQGKIDISRGLVAGMRGANQD